MQAAFVCEAVPVAGHNVCGLAVLDGDMFLMNPRLAVRGLGAARSK